MSRHLRSAALPFLAAAHLATACTFGQPAGDDKDDSFGGNGAKADGQYTECQLAQVLRFANDSTTDESALRGIDLRSEAAAAIVDHRHGPDRTAGTGDDDIFDDLAELDSVDFVGRVVLDRMVGAILESCEVDLETRPFINEETFAGSSSSTDGRDNVELESAMTVTGITGQLLHEILNTDVRGRSVFRRIAKARVMEAFTYNFDIDEMPWDGDSHDVREAFPFVPLSIEFDRYVVDDDTGERELDLGTDVMDDTYYDTYDYRLLRAQNVLRARVRWDNADTVRRLLIAAKFDPFVDDNGLKRASKVDIRTFGGGFMDDLDNDIRRGLVDWESSDRPAQPIVDLYNDLLDDGRLPTIGQHENVLILDPKVHIRSTRSRFHLNLTSRNTMRTFFDNGAARIQRVIDEVQVAIDDGTLTGADATDGQAIIALGEALLDNSAIAGRARAALLAIDPAMDVTADTIPMPDELPTTMASFEDVEKARVVAEAVDAGYHEFSELVDDLDRAITATSGLGNDEFVDMFIAWRKSERPEMRIERTYRTFLGEWNRLGDLSAAGWRTAMDAFDAFGAAELAAGNDDFEDFVPMTETIWFDLGAHLQFEVNKVSQRQIESAGTMANALWFEAAREFYVPDSSRSTGNFLIDTMDLAEMITQEEWNRIPDADRRIDVPFDPATVFNTSLVNEIQIELGQEEDYVARIEQLGARVADGSATPEDERNLTGAQFVFEQFNSALTDIAQIKEDRLIDRLRDNGAPGTTEWSPAVAGKGTTALRLLADLL